MRKAIGIALCALALGGCSQTALDAGFKNLTSVQCDNQQAALANIPLMFVTPAQAAQISRASAPRSMEPRQRQPPRRGRRR